MAQSDLMLPRRRLAIALGLGIVSQKTDRGRCYRIGESRPAAP
jgi:hypothetical protein